jgi:hypothetical protein
LCQDVLVGNDQKTSIWLESPRCCAFACILRSQRIRRGRECHRSKKKIHWESIWSNVLQWILCPRLNRHFA